MNYAMIGMIAIVIHLILNHEYVWKKRERDSTNEAFRQYTMAAFAYYVTDILWGMIYELKIPMLLYADTILYHLSIAMTVVLLCRYVIVYLHYDHIMGRFLKWFAYTFLAFEVVVLFINHFVHIFFWVDAETVYHPYVLRYVVLWLQILLCLMLAIQTGAVLKRARGEMKKRYFTIFLFCVVMTAAMTAQMLYPLLPFYSIGLVVGITIIHTFVKESEKEKQYRLLLSMADIHYSMHVIDLANDTLEQYHASDDVKEIIDRTTDAAKMMAHTMKLVTTEESLERALQFTDLTTIADRMQNKQTLAAQLVGKHIGWFHAMFITAETDSQGRPTKVIFTTRPIDEEKKQEEKLRFEAERDELTGLLNRRAYEDDLLRYADIPQEADFVYGAIDINGLKKVNDTIGHAAGDELIQGVAECLKQVFGNYGRVYRTGGDEFVTMFFADEEHLKEIEADLENTMLSWEGKLVTSLSASAGYVAKREFPEETVANMAKIADKRMYEAKAKYYARAGIDRRGQAAAYTALCKIYTKILKINLTDDTFSIISMDLAEQTPDKGFSDTISGWLSGFGKSGQVHPEDLENYMQQTDREYLKEYFLKGKASITIFYRRRYTDGFKQVAMEMIPADDYTSDKQTLFLYVKNIDI